MKNYLPATFLSAIMLFTSAAQATDFPHFDKMDSEAQAEYVARMIDTMQEALRAANESNAAVQMQLLFTKIASGDTMPLGLIMYGENEGRARVLDAERYAKDHNVQRLEVEHALILTLTKNKIPVSAAIARVVFDRMANFHAMTYAEFEARSPAAQRQFIALLVRLAHPDFLLRDAVERKLKGEKAIGLDSPDQKRRLLALTAEQFPSEKAESQPGFAGLAREIEAEYRKTPNEPGPFYSVVIHMLKMMRDDALNQMKKMDDSTYHLQGSPTPTFEGPGRIVDFGPVLGDIVRSSGRSGRSWSACIEEMVVEAQSWKNPPAARLKLLQDAMIRFLSTHKTGDVKFRISERAGNFVVEEQKGDCDTYEVY